MDWRRAGVIGSLLCGLSVAQAATEVELLESFPAGGDIVVAPNSNVYLRARYSVDSPQHIWLRPYFRGKPARAGSGTSPEYAGSGELLGWFFLMQDGAEVDEIRATAGDGSLARTPLVASWPLHVVARSGAPATAAEPPWVATLQAQREAADRAAAAAHVERPLTRGERTLVGGFMLGVPVLGLFGLLAPCWGLWRWRGRWRLAAAVPAVVMGYVVARIVVDGARDPTSHNLWPFEILMAGGCSSALMIVLFIARALIKPARAVR
ncbi:MAG: hypothetical protein KF903_05975 [Dokdonella sp.]|uniref:hypothetical protein n=1 Tax=Dokdonella sp. TaxID=2291710 RepID=UPI0025C1343A|nr:hypothetical protein [Dokdonella sp.]MBX3700532.1 hypothetical protein [Dokdonella sp.]MCW5578622.1 hypothetical protein [Dokdonella sp.]